MQIQIQHKCYIFIGTVSREKYGVVTANTRGGETRNSAPLWARGHDAFLVIRRPRDQSQLATLLVLCKVI